ncbi:MAG: DUF167 domain-containing protein [Chlamydiae bacterium]|nr:DUF167 domain-containing protein [Chlamydiota bacterium]
MALIIDVKVVPQSGKNGYELDQKGVLKWYLKSAPEKGLANKELIKALSKELRVPQNDIEITVGLTSRNKQIKIHSALTFEQFCQKLGLSYQEPLF